jgi:hypothetical protein
MHHQSASKALRSLLPFPPFRTTFNLSRPDTSSVCLGWILRCTPSTRATASLFGTYHNRLPRSSLRTQCAPLPSSQCAASGPHKGVTLGALYCRPSPHSAQCLTRAGLTRRRSVLVGLFVAPHQLAQPPHASAPATTAFHDRSLRTRLMTTPQWFVVHSSVLEASCHSAAAGKMVSVVPPTFHGHLSMT